MREEYTHLAEFYGIKCYYNNMTEELAGTNWFNDVLLDIALWYHVEFNSHKYEGFPIVLIEEL